MSPEEIEYGSRRRRKEFTPWVVAGDVVGLTTVIVSTLALILGETTPIFHWLKGAHPGVEFIFQYVALPFFPVVQRFLPNAGSDWMTNILLGLCVALMAALLYGFIAYMLVKTVCRSLKRRG